MFDSWLCPSDQRIFGRRGCGGQDSNPICGYILLTRGWIGGGVEVRGSEAMLFNERRLVELGENERKRSLSHRETVIRSEAKGESTSMKRKWKQYLALVLAIVLGVTSGLGGVVSA